MSKHCGTVYVVDNDPLVRNGLNLWLRPVGYNVQMFASFREFLLCKHADEPACLVFDIGAPPPSGGEPPMLLANFVDILPVVYISQSADVPTCVQAIKGGAIDFLVKPLREQRVLDAVGQGIRKWRDLCQTKTRTAEMQRRFAMLKPREREIITHVARGRLSKQIASDLGLSLNTVKVYRSTAMRRMQISNLAELIRVIDGLTESSEPCRFANGHVKTQKSTTRYLSTVTD